MANLIGGSSSSSQSSTAALDPQLKQAFLGNLNRATSVADNLTARQFAPRTGDYNAGQSIVRNAATNGVGLQAMNSAVGATAANMNTPSTQNLGFYMNPYTDYVAGNTLDALGRANQIALNGVAGDATKAHAWGGSRSGVAQAETNRNFADIAGRTVGDIYSSGYDKALAASNADLNRQLSAASQLSTLGDKAQQGAYQAGQNVMNLGLSDQQYLQEQLDAIRNLPLERQQIINTAMGVNPGGGSGTVSTSAGGSGQSSGLMTLFKS